MIQRPLFFEQVEAQGGSTKVLKRAEVQKEFTWNTEAIFESPEAWETALQEALQELEPLKAYKGRLGESAAVLKQYMDASMSLDQKLHKLYNYAHLKSDEDTTNSENKARIDKIQQVWAQISGALAFEMPELVSLGAEKIASFQQACPELKDAYGQYLEDKLRLAPHTLSEDLERLLAEASPIFGNAQEVFSQLNNADLRFDSVQDQNGKTHAVTHSSYGPLLENKDRSLRKAAFESIYKQYKQHSHSFAATLSGNTKLQNFMAQTRGFSSARAAAVFQNNIPEEIQQNLIDTIYKNLPLLHDYVSLRKKLMELKELYPYDLYTSMVDSVELTFTKEEAMELVLEALQPLGSRYLDTVRKAFSQRWIDWEPNEGKRSGAYSSGTYGTYPFILLNWQGTLDNVYTLIHEMGHSMHSYLTWENQPYPYANYCIFLAEIASTTNENLLTQHLLKKYPSKEMQLYILNSYLDGFKSTVFRQTQFAVFEQAIHKADQEGQALTVDFLCQTYEKINQDFYGPDLNPCEEITYEWARIPHFYYDFYVYQYATGFSAATAFSKAIMEEGQPAVERYLKFLSSGSSDYPIEVLKKAGVDMSRPEPIEAALATFKKYFDQYRSLLES